MARLSLRSFFRLFCGASMTFPFLAGLLARIRGGANVQVRQLW